jgi:FAD/FMN-containing dehydrogenase
MRDISLSVDTEAHTVLLTTGPGTPLYQIYAALNDTQDQTGQRTDWLFPGGTCPTVAVGGFTLGGGYGMVGRQVGLACDSLVDVSIVLPNGTYVESVSSTLPSLMQSLRGAGGGNFGVVTSLVFKLTYSAPPTVSVIALSYASTADSLQTVLPIWAKWASTVDHRLTSKLNGYHDNFSILGLFLGNATEAKQLVSSLLSVDNPSLQITEMSLLDANLHYSGCSNASDCEEMTTLSTELNPDAWDEGYGFWARSLYVQDDTLEHTAQVLTEYLTTNFVQNVTGFAGVLIDSYGGQISAPQLRTVVSELHRESLFHIQIMCYFNDAAEQATGETWIADFFQTLTVPYAVPPSYRNYPNPDVVDFGTSYYGADNYAALRTMKAIVDPDNLFAYNQSIPIV